MTPPSDPVEDMLRRTFTTRAEDMAPGDGAEWNPTDAPAAAVVAAPEASPAPAKRGRRAVWRRPGTSWKALWRPVVIAALAVSVVVVAVVGALLLGDDGSGDDETDSAAVTTSTRPPVEDSGQNLAESSEVGGVIDETAPDSRHMYATWYPAAEDAPSPVTDTAEQVRTNPDGGTTWIDSLAPPDGDALIFRWDVYGDGVVESIALGMTRAEVLTTEIERTDPTGVEFAVTPPSGFAVRDPG